jgi:DNA repair exonuclease SbcCD ATPase subunit
MELNNSIITIQARNSIDEKESLEIQKVLENIKSLSEEINDIESRLKSYYTSTKIKMESIDSKYNEDIELSSHYSETINNLYTDWKLSVEKLSTVESNILSTKADLESYKYDLDTKMKSKYEESSNRLVEIKKELSLFNIPDNIELIHPLTNLLEFYSRFSSQIDNFYTNCTEFVLDWIINKFDPEIMEKCSQRLSELTEEDRKCNDDIYKLEQVKEKMSVLSSRPSNCNIDSCPFINDALNLKSVYTDNDNIDKEILKIQKRKVDIAKNVTELMKNMEIYRFCLSKKQELDVIRADISNNSSNLTILNDTDLLDINRFNSMIVSGNPFNNQKDPKKCIDILNLLKALESEEKINSLLEVKYQAYQDKLNLINTTEATLYNLNIDKDNLSKSSTELKSNYDALKNTKSELDRKISIERDYISIYHTYIDKKRVLDSLLEKNAEFERKSSNALASIEVIQNYRSEIDKLTRESKPIVDEISKLSGQLTLLESYYSEYSEYSQSYNMIETLKKYCSPTAGGIQTIFMQIYMNKTLDLANQVLSMLFGGEYKLLEFVINQNEFRIPFIGNGLPVDDVSSGSTSQICIMGMVINLVLLHQASTKFNIARLDEIDGGLDHRNRFEFVNTLYRTMPILNIDQLFIISHSLEADTSAVDIIKLKSYSDFEDTVQLGNVIWDYQEEIKKTFE